MVKRRARQIDEESFIEGAEPKQSEPKQRKKREIYKHMSLPLTRDEYDMLSSIAEAESRSRFAEIRFLIRQRAEELGIV